jgi:hypothetical protein
MLTVFVPVPVVYVLTPPHENHLPDESAMHKVLERIDLKVLQQKSTDFERRLKQRGWSYVI